MTVNPTTNKRPESKDEVMGMIRNLVSTQRPNFLRKLLDQKRDLESEFGHPPYLDSADYWKKFDRGDVAARIVSIYPEECFSEAPLVYETEEDDETEFEKEWNLLNETMRVNSILLRADVLSGVGRFGVILLGIDDGADLNMPVAGFDPSPTPKPRTAAPTQNLVPVNPLPPGTVAKDDPAKPKPDVPPENDPATVSDPNFKPKRRLMYMRTFDESLVTIKQLERDPKNPRFGQPVMYELSLQINDGGGVMDGTGPSISEVPPASGINTVVSPNTSTRTSLLVHWHRIIHLADNRLRDEIFGVPRLKKVYDRVLDLHKLAGGSAEMFWKGAFPGMSLETHPSEEPVQIDKAATKEELEEYYEGLKRYFTLEGMTANQLSPQVADPGPHAELQIRLIAMALACPMRIFMGAEVGALASGQDIVAWNERLQKRREEYVSPFVIRPFVDRLIAFGILPFPKGGKGNTDEKAAADGRVPRPVYIIFWNDLNTPSSTEQADVGLKRTQAMVAYVSGGVDQLIAPSHFLELVIGFKKDEVQAILDEVGDRLVETDPELEHQQAVEKIEAAAKGNPQMPPGRGGNGNGFPAKQPAAAAAAQSAAK